MYQRTCSLIHKNGAETFNPRRFLCTFLYY
nr:MAG TPA: peptidase [Caudoviricetes sp.]